jgi:hypothetical protein
MSPKDVVAEEQPWSSNDPEAAAPTEAFEDEIESVKPANRVATPLSSIKCRWRSTVLVVVLLGGGALAAALALVFAKHKSSGPSSSQWVETGAPLVAVNLPDDHEAEGIEQGSYYEWDVSDDGTVLVTAASTAPDNTAFAGTLSLYRWNEASETDASTWQLVDQTSIEREAFDAFSTNTPVLAMAGNGKLLALGRPKSDASHADETGQVWIYDLVGDTFSQVESLAGPATGDRWGSQLAWSANGRRLVVGAPSADRDGLNGVNTGQVHLFQVGANGGVPEEVSLVLSGEASLQKFGSVLTVSGDGMTLAGGAPWQSTDSLQGGEVRVWRQSQGVGGDAWQRLGSTLPGEIHDDDLGQSLSLSGDGLRLVVAAQGQVQVYQVNADEGEWQPVGAVLSGSAPLLSADGQRLLVQLDVEEDYALHMVHVYQWENNSWTPLGSSQAAYGRSRLTANGSRLLLLDASLSLHTFELIQA